MYPPDERGQLDEGGRVALALNVSSCVRSGCMLSVRMSDEAVIGYMSVRIRERSAVRQ